MATYYVDAALGNDSNAGTSPGAGNAFATLSKAATVVAAGDKVWVKGSANYVRTATIDLTVKGDTTSGRIVWEGYTTTPGDGGRATVTTATNSTPLFTLVDADFNEFVNFNFTNTASTRSTGFVGNTSPSSSVWFKSCLFDGFSTALSVATGGLNNYTCVECEIRNCTSHGAATLGGCEFYGCWFKNNGGSGIRTGSTTSVRIASCRFTGNAIGIEDAQSGSIVVSLYISNCTVAGNTGAGIKIAARTSGSCFLALTNNAIYGNGGYGVEQLDTQAKFDANLIINRHNAYGSNTSGARSGMSAGTNDVALTANPFVDSASGDYRPNAVSGGGLLLRGAGFPTGLDYDIGAIQARTSFVFSVEG